MGFSYGVGNLGKIIGPLGLALIAGSSDLVSPKLYDRRVVPGVPIPRFLVRSGSADVSMLGFETKGGAIEEINRALDTPAGLALDPVRVPARYLGIMKITSE
jgi:putative MFS transporter